MISAWESVFVPCLVQLGDQIAEQGRDVEGEHLAAALSEEDCLWRSLGAQVPVKALCDALVRLRHAVALIWAHRADLAARVPFEELHDRSDALLAVGGPGWAGLPLPSFVRRSASLPEAIRVVLSRVR